MKLSLVFMITTFVLLHMFYTRADDDEATVEVEQESEADSVTESIPYSTPKPIGNVYLAEHFDDPVNFEKRWIVSQAKKDDAEETIAKYSGKWSVEEAEKNGLVGDLGLVLKSKAHHHAISSRLDKAFLFDNKPFILQYEVRFQHGQECGGAYLKLLSHSKGLDLKRFHDKTPYSVMFGPDKCGTDEKLHFIFRHKNPKNGSFEEKHWKRTSSIPKFDDIFKDKKPHIFTLKITPDNSFEVLIDKKSIQKGSLLEEFNPPVNPPAEVDDPEDSKPEEWDEREKIPDPNAKKPDDWDENAPRQIPDPSATKPEGWLDDEPEFISDPDAEKPADWDDEMDGDWEAPLISNSKCTVGCGKWKPPMIDNPNYKGKWKPPMINNPNYKGKWKPRKIPNPEYFEDLNPYKMSTIEAVGFELWSMSDGIVFDNIIISDDPLVVDQWTEDTWALKKEIVDRETDNVLVRLVKYTNKHPWLWAVYILVIGLPVVLFISFCCTTTPTSKEKEDEQRARAKKTDECLPDDEVGDTKSSDLPEESPDDEVGDTKSSDLPEENIETELESEKQALEEQPNEDEEEEEEGEKEQETEEEELDKPEDEETAGGGSGDVRKSPRQRRPRRE
ncbi:calnexin-like isoform X1 [Tachypleus tridentatus]